MTGILIVTSAINQILRLNLQQIIKPVKLFIINELIFRLLSTGNSDVRYIISLPIFKVEAISYYLLTSGICIGTYGYLFTAISIMDLHFIKSFQPKRNAPHIRDPS